MPRKPTGKPPGRPAVPFGRHAGWIVNAVFAFLSGDLRTQQFPAQSQREAHSGVLAFNRARRRFIDECFEPKAGEPIKQDEADVVSDIVARVDCTLEGQWVVELSARGLAMEALMRVAEKRRKAFAEVAALQTPAYAASISFEDRIEAMRQDRPQLKEQTPEELAAFRAEMDAKHAAEAAATAALHKKWADEKVQADIDATVANATDLPSGSASSETKP